MTVILYFSSQRYQFLRFIRYVNEKQAFFVDKLNNYIL